MAAAAAFNEDGGNRERLTTKEVPSRRDRRPASKVSMSHTLTARNFLSFGVKADSIKAAALLLQSAKVPTYAFSVAIDPGHRSAAHACGLARTLIKKVRGRKAHEERGDDDERIDTEGALAEILMALVLEKAPDVQVAPLVAHKPDAGGVDITLAGQKLDVKSVGQARVFVNINQAQHTDKAAAAYVMVHLVRDDVADVYVVSCEHVAGWRLNTNLRGVALDPRRYYYSMKLPTGGLEALPVEEAAS